MESPAVPALLIGALFVEKGLITQEQLDIALEEQQRNGERLGEILVERFGVSRLDLASALAEQWAEYERQGTTEQQESHAETRDPVAVSDEWSGTPEASDVEAAPKRPIGEIFLERGMVSADELEHALEEQRDSGRRLGEILVAKGSLSRLELASALADQWASFQKLRPPSAANGVPPLPAADPVPAPVMPTPEASQSQSAAAGVTSDQVDALRARLEALGTQLDQLAATTREWREPLDELSTSLGERLTAVEQAAAERSSALAADDSSKAEIAAITTRVDELAAVIATPSSQPLPADLPDRVEKLAAAIEQQEARLAELAAKEQESGEDRGARGEIAALEARLNELAQRPVAELDALRTSVADLAERVAQPVMSEEWREPLESLANDLRERIATVEQSAIPAADAAADVLRAELASLASRIDAIPAPSEGWRADVEVLANRLDELAARPTEGIDELRGEIATLAARLSATAPVDELTAELGQVAESLKARLDRVESDLATRFDDGAIVGQLDSLRSELESLSSRVAAIPAPSEEWRDGLSELAARVDALPVPTDEWRTELGQVAENLRARFDRVEAELANGVDGGAVTGQVDGLRQTLAELVSRVDAIAAPNEDWREALDALVARIDAIPENLRVRLDRIDHDLAARAENVAIAELSERLETLAGGLPERLGELRAAQSQLSDRIDAIPPPSDEWRFELAQIAENLRVRVERVESGLEQRAGFDLIAGVRDEMQALSTRIEADLRERDERAAGQGAHVEWLASRLSQTEGLEQRLRDEIGPLAQGAIAPVAARLAGIEASVEAHKAAAADVTPRLDDLAERIEKQARRIEKLREDGPTAAQVAEALNARLEASEAVATDAYASFDERLAALDGQVASAAGHATSDVQSLRRELDDLRGVTVAATETAAAYADRLAEQLRAETARDIAAALSTTEGQAAIERLDGLVAAQAAALETLRSGLHDRERLSDERFAALEKAQAKRSDVRDLRDALGRIEQHIAADTSKEDARVAAVEEAVREGLAALASRLSESEGAYFQAGDSLRRSIEHLGSAIRGADAHRMPDGDVAEAAFVVATSFLAFAPTSEGYRLVELDGAAPVVGGLVEVPGCEVPLVVGRIGASPLPFDRRPCAYLETSA